MITFSEEYLRRLADIQNEYNLKELVMLPEDEPRFIIDLDTRKIILPDEFKFLAVENDHNAETIYFEIDRYYDKQDLSQKTCIVQYKNTSDTKAIEGFYPVTKLDVDTVPGKILFGWTIENKVTVLPGFVDFSIRFYSINDSGRLPVFTYNINTLTGSLPVIDTLNTSNQGVEVIPGKVESLTAKFEALAKQAESNVLFSDDAAKKAAASAEESKANADAAKASASEAAKNAQKATDSADKSKTQADRAQSEADRAKAEADRAAAGGSIQIKNIVIPTVGWNQEADGSGSYTIDVAVEGAIETMFPSVSIHRTALSVAQKAGLCPSVQLLTGFLRFWALSPPTSNIPVTVALMTPGCLSGRGCTYVLPPATATQLGGVKIGSGITAAVDGTITASAGISSEEVVSGTDIEKMLDEIFPTDI